MRKREKISKGDNMLIAVLQAAAVFMFVLVLVRITGCAEAGENIIITPAVIEQTDTSEDAEPVETELEDANDSELMIYEYDDTEEDLEDIIGC